MLFKCIYIVVLAHIGLKDYRCRRISNFDCVLLTFIGIIISKTLYESAICILVVFAPFLIIYLMGGGIGAGDVKLVFSLCFCFTLTRLLLLLMLGMILVLIVFGFKRLVGLRFKLKMNTNITPKNIPLGTFISLGAIWVLLTG